MKPPIGRATKPTASVAKELIAETKGSWDTKYCALNTRAAAVVNRKKSYHSSAVPTRAARATFLATLSSTGPGDCGLAMVVALLALLAMITPKKCDWSLRLPVRPPPSGDKSGSGRMLPWGVIGLTLVLRSILPVAFSKITSSVSRIPAPRM